MCTKPQLKRPVAQQGVPDILMSIPLVPFVSYLGCQVETTMRGDMQQQQHKTTVARSRQEVGHKFLH